MYLFAPLDKQFDRGFGAVADSFNDAATELKEQHHRFNLNGHLPICYLFRHAIELYLKGAIIIVHRILKIPYGSNPHTSEPHLPVKGKLKTIYSIHDIALLYQYLSNLLAQQNTDPDVATNAYWLLPDDLDSKFKRLKDIDSTSAYFRYPTEKSSTFEKEKSAFKETTVETVMALATKNQEPMKTMKVTTLVGQDTQIFVHNDAFTEEAMNLLSDVAQTISTCHFALMRELGGSGLS